MSQFTNRHGKKVTVSDDEIVVNPTTQLPIAAQNPALPPKPKVRRQLPKISLSKRASLTLFVLIIIVAVAALVTADSIKRDYESQTAAMKRTITERNKQSTSTETSAEQTIKALRASLSAKADCKVQGIDVVSWYGPAKTARQDCQEAADRYKKLQLALDDMTTIATYTAKINEVLQESLAAPTSGEYGIISNYAADWSESATEIEKIAAPEIVSAQHRSLVTKVKSVSEAWNALNQANISRNTEAFKTSETNLNAKYSELRTVSDGLQTLVLSTQASINRYIAELS